MTKTALIGLSLLASATAFAGDLVQWQDNSLTYLYGTDYKIDPETQHTLTFEHVSGWSVGDLFIFVDGIYFDGDTEFLSQQKAIYYGEIAPRLSAGKILGKDLSASIFKDALVSSCWEFGENVADNYLLGGAVDLNLPLFDFVQLNLYRRFDAGARSEEAYQFTPVWKMTFPIGKTAAVFDGFIDYVFGGDVENLHICPQLKLDIGSLIGLNERKLFAGIEYDYWKNKYGIEDSPTFETNQNTFSGIVKYHF